MNEIWKSVVGYEGIYEVSTLGRIRRDGRILKGNINSHGYISVGLCKHGKRKNVNVHRLVAQTFIPNPENKPWIDHKDTNRINNAVYNLKWCTYSENSRNPITLEKNQVLNNGGNHPKSKKVTCLETLEEFDYVRGVEKELGLDHSAVSACCRRRYKQIHGLTFRYSDDILFIG